MHFFCQSIGYTSYCLLSPIQISAKINRSIFWSFGKLSALGVYTPLVSGACCHLVKFYNLRALPVFRSNSLFVFIFWQELCKAHGNSIQQNSRNLLPALKSLQKAITRIHQDLADTCSSNEYMLRYLCSSKNRWWTTISGWDFLTICWQKYNLFSWKGSRSSTPIANTNMLDSDTLAQGSRGWKRLLVGSDAVVYWEL